MNISNEAFLGGYLVGIGKIKANGEIVYNKLDNPIHNRITDGGLDHLFLWKGIDNPNYVESSAVNTAMFSSTTPGRCGALYWMSYGSDESKTSFYDTNLKSGCGTYFSTIFGSGKKGALYVEGSNGSYRNSFGNYSIRISHQSDAVESQVTVKEIGWFGSYQSASGSSRDPNEDGVPVLFSRVVLPLNMQVTLNEGESLITTYQLNIVNSGTTATTGNSFFGLMGVRTVNGEEVIEALHYEHKLQRYENTSWTNWQYSSSCSTQGGLLGYDGSEEHTVNNARVPVPFKLSKGYNSMDNYASTTQVFYSTDPNKTFPAERSKDSSVTNFYTASGECNEELAPYYGVGTKNKYRDRIVTIGVLNPNISSITGYIDIYYINFYGNCYRFGFYDNGVWIPQAWRKKANEEVKIYWRWKFTTPDTIES